MKRYKGIVTGKTIVLDEKPNLPDRCPAIVRIDPLDTKPDEAAVRKQLHFLNRPHRGRRLLYREREDLYDR